MSLIFNLCSIWESLIRPKLVKSQKKNGRLVLDAPWFQIIFCARMRVFVKTYGCQMNFHDSELMLGILAAQGHTPVEDERDAEVILLNTCAVREKAEQKVYSELGRLRRLKGDRILGICGCVAEKEKHRILERMPFVDVVLGPGHIEEIGEAVDRASQGQKSLLLGFNGRKVLQRGVPRAVRSNPYSAFITIMEGCNNFCTYCIVPYTRGRERSRPPDEIVAEAEELAKRGVKEITLLGQNVNSYGRGLPEPISFSTLLKRVSGIEGIERVRFVTSHPKDCSEELMEAMASSPKIMPYLHLPAQSGSDRVLERMGRRYTAAHYLELIDGFRRAVPHMAFSSDFIVGFPGETQEDFEATLELIKKVGYHGVFAFRYSVREGTEAAKWEDDVPKEVKSERLTELFATQDPITERISKSYLNQRVEVLFDRLHSEGVLEGRTPTNKIVRVKGDEEKLGEILPVKIKKTSMYILEGEIETEVSH